MLGKKLSGHSILVYVEMKYRRPSLFAGVMFLENPANNKTADNKAPLFFSKKLLFFLQNVWKSANIKNANTKPANNEGRL